MHKDANYYFSSATATMAARLSAKTSSRLNSNLAERSTLPIFIMGRVVRCNDFVQGRRIMRDRGLHWRINDMRDISPQPSTLSVRTRV